MATFFSTLPSGRVAEACMMGFSWVSFWQLSVDPTDVEEASEAVDLALEAGLKVRHIPHDVRVYRAFREVQN